MPKQGSIFSAADELSPIIGEELAKAFVEHRKMLKAPMTSFAAKLMAKKLAGMADPVASVEQSLIKGWRDCFPVDRQRLQPTVGLAAVEDEIRKEIDAHFNGQTRQESPDPEDFPRLPLLGWEGHNRPH